MTPPQWLVFELSSHYGASAENGASHHLGMSGAPSDGGSAAHAALSLAVCNSAVTVLITPEVCELPPNRRQAEPVCVRI